MAGEPQADCLFCKIVAGEIPATVVRESANTLAFRDISPKAKVHVLVVPRAHHANALELAAAAPAILAELITEAAAVAEQEGVGEGYRLIFNTGEEGGQTVFHTHAHVLGGSDLSRLF